MSDNKERRVAIYMRVANANQLAIEKQEADLRQYAEKQGYTDLLTYADNGHSGLSFDRTAFRQLRADIESGKVGKVIAADMSRITRDWKQAHGFLNILKLNHVELDTLNGSHDFHKTEADQFVRMLKGKNRSGKDRER